MKPRILTRRQFVGSAAALVAALAARPVFGQDAPPRRGAVVIGVNKTGDLPVLTAAVVGANQVARWLEDEGFVVKRFVDADAPVKVSAVFEAVEALVALGTLEQLVVYFAGHGFARLYNEFWLFSGAPGNPNEAVSLAESAELARHLAIPNVVFISDACRSFSDDPRSHRIQGSLIFPNPQDDAVGPPADVDLFMATRVGDSAFEARLTRDAAALEGLFTSVFLQAYLEPDPEMRQQIGGRWVVPNRRLKSYLLREVARRAEALPVPIRQIPDTRVNSDDTVYIGSVRRIAHADGDAHAGSSGSTSTASTSTATSTSTSASAGTGSPGDGGFKPTSLPGVAEWIALGPMVSSRAPEPELEALLQWAPGELRVPGYQASVRTTYANIRDAFARLPDAELGRTGIAVRGAKVTRAWSGGSAGAEIRPAAASPGSHVALDLRGVRGATILLQFESGGGAVVAALDNFIANIAVDQFGVNSVSYVPSRFNEASEAYRAQAKELAGLHALIATATRLGAFRLEGSRTVRARSAQQLADRIRIWKSIDPTLGIYAAYAYANAGLPAEVRSVRDYLRMDLGVDLFDVSLLAGDLAKLMAHGPVPVVPLCPVLAEGWNLLRVKNANVPEPVLTVRSEVTPALWTTVSDAGLRMLEDAYRATHPPATADTRSVLCMPPDVIS